MVAASEPLQAESANAIDAVSLTRTTPTIPRTYEMMSVEAIQAAVDGS
jgi:hypothetical protein